MTASSFDPRLRRSLLALSLSACRAGLPPEPPGADAADAGAAIPAYHAAPSPYETSAFAGEATPADTGHAGHAGMHHGAADHAGHTMTPAATDPDEHPKPTAPSSHAGHTTEAPR